jgi:DNA-binding protein Fis
LSALDGPEWIGRVLSAVPAGVGLNEILSAFEEAVSRGAMRAGGGVQSRAADLLGLKRNVFKYKWDKFAGVPASDLSLRLSELTPEVSDLGAAMADLEREIIGRALIRARGAQGKAADLLGLKRNVIPYKFKKYPALAALAEEEARRQGY